MGAPDPACALDSLMGEYEVSREQIERDMLNFIEDLKANGLVEQIL